MNPDLGTKLHSISLRQRDRIWLSRVLHRSAPALWYSALLLSLAAGIHQLALPLNPLLTIAIATVPSVLFLAFLCVAHKPLLREGAADADRRLGANSLFVSAWELSRTDSEPGGTARLLLERCESAMPGWSRSTPEPPREYLKLPGLIAFTLAAVGLFFLLQPSHVQPQMSAAPAPLPLAEPAEAEVAAAIGKLDELRENGTPPATRAGVKAPDASADAAVLAEPPLARPSADTEFAGYSSAIVERPATPGATPVPATRGSSPDPAADKSDVSASRSAGTEAGEAAAADIIHAQGFDRIRPVGIETGSDYRSAATDESIRGTELQGSKPGAIVSRESASAGSRQIAAGGATWYLSPQQRELVARYFAQLEKVDAPNK